jgi:hypothetical protein
MACVKVVLQRSQSDTAHAFIAAVSLAKPTFVVATQVLGYWLRMIDAQHFGRYNAHTVFGSCRAAP